MIRKNQLYTIIVLDYDIIINSIKESLTMESFEIITQTKPNPSIDIAFREITYQVPNLVKDRTLPDQKQPSPTKTILHGVSGIFKGGELTAIMGSSGAGKTTLLNVISGRVSKFKGELLANSHPYTFETFGTFANYVMQQDILMQTLTVRETLMFAASLKYANQEKIQERILYLTKNFKLEKCLDVLIGGPNLKGISGGQKKRTSIVFELISDPFVIALDEPTSGMDSLTSYIIVKELKALANQGKTVFLTIHQPNNQIFDLFDRLLLMVEGRIIYQGKPELALSYFQQNFKLICPNFANPADYLIDIIHAEKPENIQKYGAYFETYEAVLKDSVESQIENRQKGNFQIRFVETTRMNTLKQLIKRDVINILRNPILIKSRFIQIIYLTIYVGGLYFNAGRADYTNILSWSTITGFLFFIILDILFQAMVPIALVFPSERSVFLKEENSKMYGVFSYFMSRNIVDIPFLVILPAIYSLVTYWMVGLSSTPAQFFIMYLILFLMTFVGSSIGLLAGSFLQDEKGISEIIPIFLLPMIVISGFFKNSDNMSKWYGWIQYISPFKYGFAAITQNQVSNKDSLVELLNFDMGLWQSIAALVGLGLLFRVLSCYLLWVKKSKLE